MKSVNLTGLRNIRKLKAMIACGEPIELRERRTVIGWIVPEGCEFDPESLPPEQAPRSPSLGTEERDRPNSGL